METYVMKYKHTREKLFIIDAEILLLFSIISTMNIPLANDNCVPC